MQAIEHAIVWLNGSVGYYRYQLAIKNDRAARGAGQDRFFRLDKDSVFGEEFSRSCNPTTVSVANLHRKTGWKIIETNLNRRIGNAVLV